MDLYLIRHADAVPLGEQGITDDAHRPLSAKGIIQTIALAASLGRMGVRLDKIVSSPLLREANGRGNAEIVASCRARAGFLR